METILPTLRDLYTMQMISEHILLNNRPEGFSLVSLICWIHVQRGRKMSGAQKIYTHFNIGYLQAISKVEPKCNIGRVV
jgi:hypothetical protein